MTTFLSRLKSLFNCPLIFRECVGMASLCSRGTKRKDMHTQPSVGKTQVKRVKADPGEEKYDSTDYYFDDYMRKVYPYFFTYTSNCKGRWIGHKLIDVMRREFRALPEESLIERLETGTTLVNNSRISSDYVMKNADYLESKVHRHELPVLGLKIHIIHDSDDVLVVDKPPSIPVHPCGRYRYNSMAAILNREYGYKTLHIVHRLDRLTSGVLIFAKTNSKARALTSQIMDRSVQKEYLCRVEGDFPYDNVVVDQPIETLSHKVGICIISQQGKQSVTTFKKISFNGKTSLVRCQPKTGRMHQIRLHLQYLGHPIENDPLYNSLAFGPQKGKDALYGKTKEELIAALHYEHCIENWVEDHELAKRQTHDKTPSDFYFEDFLRKELGSLEPVFDESKLIKDETCIECKLKYVNPSPKHLLIYLHALKYSGTDWSYESKLPLWAKPEWKE